MKPALLGTYLALLLVSSAVIAAELAPMPKPTVGRIERLADFSSKYVSARNVDVWLPPGYSERQKYAVLYMQDGQMLFDASTTWNKQEWQADEIAAKLITAGKVHPFIIVGIFNAGKLRNSEYFPQRVYDAMSITNQAQLMAMTQVNHAPIFSSEIVADQYLKFLTKELKPYIDSHYSVLKDPSNTAVMGSSRGGLISLYAISEYPNVFGSAACLSTHWSIKYDMENNPLPDAIFDYLREYLPEPSSHRLYFDYGTATLDALYLPLQAKADAVMREKGYNASNWQTLRFEGAEHSEKAWAARLDIPLQFLFPPRNED